MNKHTNSYRIYFSNLISSIIIQFFKRKIKGSNNNILLVNTEKLGDLVLCADFLNVLRTRNEYGSYFLILDKQYLELFDTKKSGFAFIPLNKKRYKFDLFYRLKFILRIRKAAFVTVINLSPERGMINEEIVLTSGACKKIALKETSFYLNKKILLRNNNRYNFVFSSNEVNEYKRMMAYLSATGVRSNILSLTMPPDYIRDEEYIVVAPMASEMERTWGLNNYKQLINNLKHRIILLGLKSEREILNELGNNGKNILNLAGEVSLSEAAVIIKKARLFIGNDSGLTHIALYLNVPLIAIIGGGKHNIFFPYKEREDAKFLANKMDCFGCSWFCIHQRMECFDVSIEHVLNAAESIYENR